MAAKRRNRGKSAVEIPAWIMFWTADEVAECLKGLSAELCGKLWEFQTSAKVKTPMGGDGSPDSEGNPTVETPDGRLGEDEDDKPRQWWPRLTREEREQIVALCEKQFGK
jgi:hypothetical protein